MIWVLKEERIEFYRNKWRGSIRRHVKLNLKQLLKDIHELRDF